MMRRLLKFIYDTWYGAVACVAVLFALSTVMSVALMRFGDGAPAVLKDVMVAVNVALLVSLVNGPVAVIVSCARGRWWRAVGQIFSGLLLLVAMVEASLHMLITGSFGASEDHFADELKIPQDVVAEEPLQSMPSEGSDFCLVNGSQGGIYSYQATIDPGEDGAVYLRAFEASRGTRLSAWRMERATREEVVGKGKHVVGKDFTIYEGDWGKFYAARLEIWFTPANGGKPRKLNEKVFKIQGWMR